MNMELFEYRFDKSLRWWMKRDVSTSFLIERRVNYQLELKVLHMHVIHISLILLVAKGVNVLTSESQDFRILQHFSFIFVVYSSTEISIWSVN